MTLKNGKILSKAEDPQPLLKPLIMPFEIFNPPSNIATITVVQQESKRLEGVRQVGKTWVLKEFGKTCYDNVAYFNFDENEEYKEFFETTKDIERILQNLIFASGQKIIKEKSLGFKRIW
jgi:predicted AAA+ superfamily ATPase